jgi:hypothetical protein
MAKVMDASLKLSLRQETEASYISPTQWDILAPCTTRSLRCSMLDYTVAPEILAAVLLYS